MSKLVLNGDVSGSVTLDAPSVSGTTTLTLPTTSGTLAITAAPTFTGQATIPTINLTGGQITFPATKVPSADANTLDDYEEGTWTPVGNGVTLTSVTGIYTKIGNVVHVNGFWTYPTNSNASAATISGLPFTSISGDANFVGTVTVTNYGSDNLYPIINAGASSILVRNNSNSDITNATLSNRFIIFMATYRVA
jgi:hypothetical protein